MANNKRKRLVGPHGMIKDISDFFTEHPEELSGIESRTEHPSPVTIRWALRYQLNSPLGKLIRDVAREHFGAQPTFIEDNYED